MSRGTDNGDRSRHRVGDSPARGRGLLTHLVLRDGLPLASWVEHRSPRHWGLEARVWDEVRVGPDGTAELVGDDDGGGWRDDVGPSGHELWPDVLAPDELWREAAYGEDAWGAWERGPLLSVDELRWREIADEVGGDAVLRALDDRPLPTEGLDPELVPGWLLETTGAVLDRLDEVFAQWPDDEWRTACHRLLGLAVGAAPKRVRDHAPAKTAAALYWAIGRASHLIGPRQMRTNAQVLDHFGLPRGAVVDHAHRLIEPGVGLRWGAVHHARQRVGTGLRLGRPELLLSGRRAAIVRERDRLLLRLEPGTPRVSEPPALESGPARPSPVAGHVAALDGSAPVDALSPLDRRQVEFGDPF